MTTSASQSRSAYSEAGVDIDLAHVLLDRVKTKISATRRPEALAPIGGFGGLFRIDLSRYRHPVMVTSIDGVGTKLMVAEMMEKHDTVGHDIVNHCINDIVVQGAEPLYFTDYIGIGRLRSPLYEDVLEGQADACRAQNVTLLAGETAEMPDMYAGHYDLVGAVTGIVEEDAIISGEHIAPGNTVLGLASNGLHTNGYSLARKVLFDQAGRDVHAFVPELDQVLGEALLEPHTCYWPCVKGALAAGLPLLGMAHITGGGWYDNLPRILPEGTGARCRSGVLPVPGIFELICTDGDVARAEMHRVFNMGVGMMWVLPTEAVLAATRICAENQITAAALGEIVEGDRTVTIDNL